MLRDVLFYTVFAIGLFLYLYLLPAVVSFENYVP